MKKIAIALVLALGFIGCAAQKRDAEEAKQVAIECGRVELQEAVQDLLPVVLAVLNGDSPDWARMLEGLATEMGEDALACTLNRLAASHPEDGTVARMTAKRAEASVSESGKAKAQVFIGEKGWAYQQ